MKVERSERCRTIYPTRINKVDLPERPGCRHSPLRAGAPLACLSIRHIDLDDSDFRRRLEDVRQTFSSTGRPVCRAHREGSVAPASPSDSPKRRCVTCCKARGQRDQELK